MAKTSKAKQAFPEALYVRREDDTDGSYYFVASESVNDIPSDEDGATVAVYRLTHIAALRTTRELV